MSSQDLGQYNAAVRQNGLRLNSNEPLVALGSVSLPTGTAVAGVNIYAGSGAPSISPVAQGSLYLRTDGSSTSTRLYVAGASNTWIAVTTAS